ncbi:unnamed protein product [Hymenolepis diminuta]|uniref:Uncharacterized protein n=1 Tax=Hymenolepis diminuta TaxID=6216 RepID=A0A3P6WRZ2_HYMDI|nr:unnamed protein product [Hymenolepis diminuta]
MSAIITYDLGKANSSPPIKYWCTYRGKVSQGYTRSSVKQRLERTAMTRFKRLRPAVQIQKVEQPNSDSDAAKLHSLSKGSSRNHNLENCLCIKSLANTYKPKRLEFKRKGSYNSGGGGMSSTLWSQMALPSSFKIPLTEPTPRRKPLSNLAYFPSYHNELPSEPQNSMPDEVVYDDVHQSTIYFNNADSASQQNLPFDGFLPTVPGTPTNGQKCIVDQNGMVYVAMCHVSQTPRQMRANLTASRVTLTTFQPEASPKLNQRPQGGQDNSIRTGTITTLNPPSANYLPRKEFSGNTQKSSSANPDLMGLPPQPQRKFAPKPETNTASISSGLNPPIPFADHEANEDEFDDIFDMSKDTLLKSHRDEKLKTLHLS